jgi:hypothetical protein
MRTPAHSRHTCVRRSALHTALYAAVAVHSAGAAVAAIAVSPGLATFLGGFVLLLVAILFAVAAVLAPYRAECPSCGANLVVPSRASSEAPCDRCAAPVVSHAGRVFVAGGVWSGERRREWQVGDLAGSGR